MALALNHYSIRTTNLDACRDFYERVLGFDLMAEMPSALFLSAGGYHHHLGMNIWHSRGASPAPEGSAGLRHFTVIMPSQAALDEVIERLVAANVSYGAAENGIVVQDPSQNQIFFTVGAVTGSLVESTTSVAR